MFLGKKSQKFSFFPLSSYTRVKSWKYVFISTSNGYNSKKKEREFFVHIFKLSLIPNVSFGTSSSSKYASHQIPGLGRH